jgi:hypothetical protein
MRTHPLLSIMTALAASFALASCDLTDKDDTVACAGDDCEEKMDGMDDDAGDEESEDEGDGEEDDGAGESAPGDGGGGGDGGGIPPECASLCACVADLGANEGACGQQCSMDLFDDDPNDRAQCVDGLAMAGFADCAPECDSFPDGT